ncbi:AglZ/HisF2 family acetamidino modification protein [Sansalvadorimonas sp. 2012CJ34-2]|uniref:imidazole glycerol-phosphate synthase n=1 Tax=Parendozoicomonas callyspongiae TaxID=2942213 RepID=A0ABT0PKZ7_9GAMM|nr:AglZ/HisF2 family acetamidino modification protein [Sansalvadorimonas sp. 2012CJ34-2]
MLRPRIIPCLLVHQRGLVKTVEFKNPKYVGDPINAVKIFNEKEADELVVLDIDATVEGKEPDYKMIEHLAAECRMPLCYGGGVRTVEQAKRIIGLGVEKVAISSAAISNSSFVTDVSDAIGRQSVAVVIDVRKKTGLFSKGYSVCTHNGRKVHKVNPVDLALEMQKAGAGEVVINSIDNDGHMNGYDFDMASTMRRELGVPLTILGGCGKLEDIEKLISSCGVVGCSAGSLFVFKGPYKAVLINYPNSELKDKICMSGLATYAEK